MAAIRRIRELLYEERYTIPGARQRLAEEALSDGVERGEVEDELPSLGAGGRARVRAAGDKGGGAAIQLDAALAAARRIERTLDRLATSTDERARR